MRLICVIHTNIMKGLFTSCCLNHSIIQLGLVTVHQLVLEGIPALNAVGFGPSSGYWAIDVCCRSIGVCWMVKEVCTPPPPSWTVPIGHYRDQRIKLSLSNYFERLLFLENWRTTSMSMWVISEYAIDSLSSTSLGQSSSHFLVGSFRMDSLFLAFQPLSLLRIHALMGGVQLTWCYQSCDPHGSLIYQGP